MADESKQVNIIAPPTSVHIIGDSHREKSNDDDDDNTDDSHEISRQEDSTIISHDTLQGRSSKSPKSPKVSLKQKAHTLTERSSHTAHKIKDKTVDIYQSASWCAFPRWIGQTPRNWPRVTSFILGIVVPLWILIGLAFGFGFLLAGYEDGNEIESNDAIMAARARIRLADVEEEILLRLPIVCMEEYVANTSRTQIETLIPDAIALNQNSTNYTCTDAAVESVEAVNLEMLADLELCVERYTENYVSAQGIREASSGDAFSSLSFNWNRCWNESLIENVPRVIFYPSEEIIAASHPDAQAETFQTEWNTMQQELFRKYLPVNATDQERAEALERSIVEASGGGSCGPNLGGTAWFFFTIMTTVGYGNQAPVTYEGRALIYSAGFVSLIAFGAVLATAGYVLSALVDDFVSRFWLSKFISKPWVGVIVWGVIWLAWALILATDIYWWWEARLPEFGATVSDSIWFAYISTSTIGLGDFYPQPEIVFASDAFKFSLNFLVGFVFLSTFFNKIIEFIQSILPQRENSLEARLKATRFLLCWPKHKGKLPEDEEDKGPQLSPEEQARVDRIEALRAFLKTADAPPFEPPSHKSKLEPNHSSSQSEADSSYHGDREEESVQSDNTMPDLSHLFDQEELILRELLAHLQDKRREGRAEYSA